MPNEVNINDIDKQTPEEERIQFMIELKTMIKDFYNRTKNDHINIFDVITGNGKYSVQEIIQGLGVDFSILLLEVAVIINAAIQKADSSAQVPELPGGIESLIDQLKSLQ